MNSNLIYYGSTQEPVKPLSLNAGPLSLVYEKGFLRNIHLVDEEVVNTIYYALRDKDWHTYHGTIKNEKIKSSAKGFEISYRAVCSEGRLQYVFDCLIKGTQEGKIEFTLRGESYSNFQRNRIGFCVLHSVKSYAGKPLKITGADKSENEGIFPVQAEPFQPFINIRAMHWEPMKGWDAEMKFDGDIFEMEDQRNWSDATYKTYCTPIAQPIPVEIKMGDTIKQKITLQVMPQKKSASLKQKAKPGLSLTVSKEPLSFSLPALGICDSSVYRAYTDQEPELIKALNLDHLRVDLDLTSSLQPKKIEELKAKSQILDLPLLLALHFGGDPLGEIGQLTGLVTDDSLNIRSFVLFNKEERFSREDILEKIPGQLRIAFPSAKIGGGSNQYFAELNRHRIQAEVLDFMAFPSTPQAHLVDNRTMNENMEGCAGAVITAKNFTEGKPVHVSPLTILYREDPHKNNSADMFMDQLPSDVDPRQMSLFLAAWTLGSIKYLGEAGAAGITLYETTGWKGIMQGKDPSALPSEFRAQPQTVFPVYYLFYWLGKMTGARIVPVESSQPLELTGFMLQHENERHLLVANHTDHSLEFSLHNFRKGKIISRLNEKNAVNFMKDPLTVLTKITDDPVEGNIPLMPFEILVMKG